jgi:hypothetical protein
LDDLRGQNVSTEGNVRRAFEGLLADTARHKGWTLVSELSEKSGGSLVRPDGTVRDANSLPRGYWEAKDTKDDLDTEIKRKIARGYRLSNTIFEDTRTGVLYQNKQEVLRAPLGDPAELAKLLNQFFRYTEPDIEPPGEHHRLGAGPFPHALCRQEDRQVGHLLLRLRLSAPSRIPREVCREPEARAAAHPAGERLPRLCQGRKGAGAAPH